MKRVKIISLLASMSLLLVAVLAPAMSASAEEVTFPAIYGTEKTVLEDFNDMESGNNGWNNCTVYSEVEGADGRAIPFSLGYVTLPEPWNMTGLVDGQHAFKLRIWAEKDFLWPSNNADWNIYMGNDTTGSTESNIIDQSPRIAYGKRFYLHAGWNEVYLPITSQYVSAGSLSELSQITHVRMFDTGASEGGAVYLDEIAVVSYTPADPVYDAVNRVLYLDSMDDPAPYVKNTTEVQFNTDCQEGLGSLSVGGGHNWIKREYAPAVNAQVDTTNGAVKFELYLSAPENLSNLWFVLKSEGDGELNWQKDAFGTLKAGWQEVTLKFSDASNKNFDVTKVNFSHIEMNTTEGTKNLLGMDNLRIVNLDGPAPVTPSTPATSTPAGTTSTAPQTGSASAVPMVLMLCGLAVVLMGGVMVSKKASAK